MGRKARDLVGDLVDAVGRLQAETDSVERAKIEREIAQIKAVRDLQMAQSQQRFSPMRIGQFLIVVPFGLWWASIFAVSIINPQIQGEIVVLDVPPHIMELSVWLIPLLVAGTVLERRLK